MRPMNFPSLPGGRGSRGVARRHAAARTTFCMGALLVGLALGAGGCASPPPAPEPVDAEALALDDSLLRLQEALGSSQRESIFTVLNSLEHLMPSWETHQRTLSEEPLEGVLMRTVVLNFDGIVDQLHNGAHERKVVAAWALGFSRVPDNDYGIASRHGEAIEHLLQVTGDAPDDVLSNAMIAIWKLADPDTPKPPLLDLVVNHHDGLVRANATLALGAVITPETAHLAQEATLVALADPEPKVRLHAASIARRHPTPAYTRSLEQLIPTEEMARVRANMAAALGAARSRTSAPVLVPLLDSPRVIESTLAHQALVDIFGEDLGDSAEDWEGVLP